MTKKITERLYIKHSRIISEFDIILHGHRARGSLVYPRGQNEPAVSDSCSLYSSGLLRINNDSTLISTGVEQQLPLGRAFKLSGLF